MNKLTIIGNLTRDPELRTTQSGISVCSFTVAVNRRQTAAQRSSGQQAEADYFRVSAWRELGENCAKWLIKGKKVCVIGPVSVNVHTGQDGKTYANLEVSADDVEFLSPAGVTENTQAPQPAQQTQGGFTEVETDELPF
jgi:single-strand DNA-binding protein